MAPSPLDRYDALYLSPHLDDAVLSCGGQIHAQTVRGRSVLVVTLTAGDPPHSLPSAMAASLHERWGSTENMTERRKAEDEEACRTVGADLMHIDRPDAIYRVDDAGQALYTGLGELFGRPHPQDLKSLPELVSRLAELPPASAIRAPLGVGGHVDHQLVRLAAEALCGAALSYYEDFPYVRHRRALDRALGRRASWREPIIVPIDGVSLRARLDGAASYRSQLSMLFKDRTGLERQVCRYVRRVGGERLWRRADS